MFPSWIVSSPHGRRKRQIDASMELPVAFERMVPHYATFRSAVGKRSLLNFFDFRYGRTIALHTFPISLLHPYPLTPYQTMTGMMNGNGVSHELAPGQ